MTRTEQVAAAVEAARTSAGIGKDRLADQSGIPQTTLKRRLAGVSPFTVAELDAVASVLGVEIETLLGLDAA